MAAVDSRAQLIVHAEAFGTGQENALLPEVAEHVRSHFASLGKPDPFEHATVLGDSGDHSEASLKALHDVGIEALVADNGFRKRDPKFADAWKHKPKDKQRKPGERRSKGVSARRLQLRPRQEDLHLPQRAGAQAEQRQGRDQGQNRSELRRPPGPLPALPAQGKVHAQA